MFKRILLLLLLSITFIANGGDSDGRRIYRKYTAPYDFRVRKDGGSLKNINVVNSYIDMCQRNGMYESIKFGFLTDGGGKLRNVSASENRWSKLYSFVTTNDATQTTSTSQPYLTGNIAPNEKWGLKNPNGGSMYMTHPTISFAANEAWSVTTVVNWNGTISSNDALYGKFSTPNSLRIGLKYNSSNRFVFYRDYGSSVNVSGEIGRTNKAIGKNILLTVVANGNNTISYYINGVLEENLNFDSSAIFSDIFRGHFAVGEGNGISAHIIRSQALTPSQVASEANYLRTQYPEIPSVTIGTQTWSSSNFDAVCTPQGNLIANVTENANVEKITNAADREFSSDTGFWNKGTGITIADGVCHFNNVNANQDLSKSGLVTQNKWYKVTLTISNYVSGNISVISGGGTSGNLNSNGTYTIYIKATTTDSFLYIGSRTTGTTLDIDNVSFQEVGWSGSTDLYNVIYAQTSGTDEQKTYAAVKASAFWCYYNNDPSIGAIYNKLYNWYAVKLLQMDIDYYNAANPTTPWGWRVPTGTDFNTLATTLGGASVAGGKMKKDGLVYFQSPNTGATNSSGFSMIAGGLRDQSGGYGNINNVGDMWSINAYAIRLATSTTEVTISENSALSIRGRSLRLIKN